MAYLTPVKIAEIVAELPKTKEAEKITLLLRHIAQALADDINIRPIAGTKALGVLRVANPVQDGETVTIGTDVYEVDTSDAAGVVEGNIRVDLKAGSTVKAQGTLTVANVCVAGDTMTIGTKVYTFVPIGTANGDGEIEVGTDQLTQEAAIRAAVNGTDGYNVAHPLVTLSAFAAHVGTLTAIEGGTAGNLIATTETMTPAGNIFDGVTLGTATSGVDPIADEFTDALEAAINASGTEPVTAVKIGANEVLVFADAIGVNEMALAETMAGANCAWDTTKLRAGTPLESAKFARVSRVPNAVEVALGNMHIPLTFAPSAVVATVRVTSDGAAKAWDGKVVVTAGDNPYVTLDNSGNVDWAATDTVTVVALQ